MRKRCFRRRASRKLPCVTGARTARGGGPAAAGRRPGTGSRCRAPGRSRPRGSGIRDGDRDHDLHIDQHVEGIGRVEAEQVGAEHPAERPQRAAKGEGGGEQDGGAQPHRFRHAPVLDRRPHHEADARPLQAQQDGRGRQPADADHQQLVGIEAERTELHLLRQGRRQRHRPQHRAEQQARDGAGHKDQADAEQHLVQLAAPVQAGDQRAFQQRRERRDQQRRQHEHGRPGQPGPGHGDRGHIAARHREDAMGQVHESHQPERHRQPDRDQVQDAGIGERLEGDVDDRAHDGAAQAGFIAFHGSRTAGMVANSTLPGSSPTILTSRI